MARRRLPSVCVDGERFRSYLEYRGISVSALAESIGVNKRYLYQSAKDGRISLAVATDVCEYLNCRAEAIFGPQDRAEIGRFVESISVHFDVYSVS